MFSLPTFLSFPWSLPSLPSVSLPVNIQRRFLSYLLKRSLGRFVKAGGLDVERIQAQISEGWVEIEALEVDTVVINDLISPALPLHLTCGSLSKVTARVPYANLWSAPISLTLDTLLLEFTVAPLSSKGKSAEVGSRPTKGARHQSLPDLDLAASVTSAADEFLHEQLNAFEEAALDRSIRQSLILSETDPFSPEIVPGAFPGFPATAQAGPSSPSTPSIESTTVLASLVERVLARLEVAVRNVQIRVRNEDKDHGAVFEFRIGECRYTNEGDDVNAMTRSIRLSAVSMYTLPLLERVTRSAGSRTGLPSSRSSSTSSMSSDTSSKNEYSKMVMSQAVADLRRSTTSSLDTGFSVYQSALSEVLSGAHAADGYDGRQSRAQTPTGHRQADAGALMLDFGTQDIVLLMRTSRALSSNEVSSNAKSLPHRDTSADRAAEPATPQIASPSMPAVSLDITVGIVGALVQPNQMATLLSALQMVDHHLQKSSTSSFKATKIERDPVQARFDFALRVDAFVCALIYDTVAEPVIPESLTTFWQRPISTYLPIGHVKLRIEGLRALFSSRSFKQAQQNLSSRQPHSRPPNTRSDTRRRSSTAISQKDPPKAMVEVTDMSIFEYLASDQNKPDKPHAPDGAFPILLFDDNLPEQYPTDIGTRPSATKGTLGVAPFFLPEFESVDWRNSGMKKGGGGDEKAWKIRHAGRGVLKHSSTSARKPETEPVIRVMDSLFAGVEITVRPLHLFLDLSLIDRLLPSLRHIAPLIKASHSEKPLHPKGPTPSEDTQLNGSPPTPLKTAHFVLDDLAASAADMTPQITTQDTGTTAKLVCPFVRLDIRCPAPINQKSSWGYGTHLRSGVVTLDVIHAAVTIGKSTLANIAAYRSSSQDSAGSSVQWQNMMLSFCRVSHKRASAFLVIGPLQLDAEETGGEVLFPICRIQPTSHPNTNRRTQLVSCQIPSIQGNITHTTIEGLQFFADDITHWLNGAFGDGSAPRPKDDLKMIGSRFFGGSKGSSSASSSVIEAEEEDIGVATMLKLGVSEFGVLLYVPRGIGVGERPLSLRASDIEAKAESNTIGRQETTLTVIVSDADFSDASSTPFKIFGRTAPLSLAVQNRPLVRLSFSTISIVDTTTKMTVIDLIVSSATVFVNRDIVWVDELAAFAKTPEGVFEDVIPSEVTRIAIRLVDCSLHAAPPSASGALVVVIKELELRTDVESGAESNNLALFLGGGHLLAIDDRTAAETLPAGFPSSFDAWRRSGYAPLVEIVAFDAQGTRDFTGSRALTFEVEHVQIRVTVCADSLITLNILFTDLATLNVKKAESTSNSRTIAPLEHSVNVFGSIDEEAFHRVPDVGLEADLIEDDLPSNPDYLDQASQLSANLLSRDRNSSENLESWQSAAEVNGEANFGVSPANGRDTIRILYTDPIEMQENYWDSVSVVQLGGPNRGMLGQFRLRVHDCESTILLHDGYDWQQTRKVIENEIKAVRRKLERIRQLLASGQKADESIENASAVLFNSVYIGLDQSKETMDRAALIAAIDEELEDLGADTASHSSWQTSFPPTGPGAAAHHRARLKGRRLSRSKRAQVEVSLTGVKVDLDMYGCDDPTASRLHLTVKCAEILDHIKTSTWKKFLTEMKSDSRGNIRETDADMIRIELLAVRPSLPASAEEELRLRAKTLPLRLHIDQDALDFLKRFFSFEAPAPTPTSAESPSPAAPKPTSTGPFFQHVEILPIELKLDYKPKRVDYAALRDGKTIELMNFFHFEGAEFTLRHISLSGVMGWSRISSLLQDIWTPDVKANQLADVLSGVSPIRSMVNVGSGVADLILLPIEQYKKDGRVARGVQKGTSSFVRSTALEMMKLGARLATGTQVVLEKAEGVLGGTFSENVVGEVGDPPPHIRAEGEWTRAEHDLSSEDEVDLRIKESTSRYANQPGDVKEGVQAAYRSLSRNFNSAAQTVLAVPMEVYERPGEDGPLRAVVRAVPIAVLKPMIGASEAVSKTLLGMRNSLDPEGRKEQDDKYK